MATGTITSNKAEAPPVAAPSGAQWLLLALTLLLIALALFQFVYVVPRCMNVIQHLVGHLVPAPLRLLISIPVWLGMVAGLALGAFAVWQRGSLNRVTLLATLTLAINVGLLLSIVNSLFQVLSR